MTTYVSINPPLSTSSSSSALALAQKRHIPLSSIVAVHVAHAENALRIEAYAEALQSYQQAAEEYLRHSQREQAIGIYARMHTIAQLHLSLFEHTYIEIISILAKLHQKEGDIKKMHSLLEEGALFWLQKEAYPKALPFLRERALGESHPYWRMQLAEALIRSGEIEEALHIFAEIAAYWMQKGYSAQALSVLERFLSYCPNPVCARLAAELYFICPDSAAPLRALSKLEICLQANPSDTVALTLLVRALSQLGEGEKAAALQKTIPPLLG